MVHNVLHAGNAGIDLISDIEIDQDGSIFIAGTFSGELMLPGLEDPLISRGGTDAFVARLSNANEVVWIRTLGGPSEDVCFPAFGTPGDAAHGIQLDGQGGLYVYGEFIYEADFDGDDLPELTTTGRCNYFLAKYSQDGDLMWTYSTGNGARDVMVDLTITSEGGIITTGLENRPLDIDGDGASDIADAEHAFIKWFSRDGDVLDARYLGGVLQDGRYGTASGSSIAQLNNGSIVVAGDYRQTLALDPKEEVVLDIDDCMYLFCLSTFLVAYSAEGDILFHYDAPGDISKLLANQDGTFYAAGSGYGFTKPQEVLPDEIIYSPLVVALLTGTGSLLWQQSTTLTQEFETFINSLAAATDIELDTNGNLVVSGVISNMAADFDGDAVPELSAPWIETFLARYRADGQFIDVQDVTQSESDPTNYVSVRGISIDPVQRVHLAGSLKGTVELTGMPSEQPFVSAGDWDMLKFTYESFDPPLPVELLAFTALAAGDAVTLSWTTASETNNAGFDVQHRVDDTWKTIAHVPGNGTTVDAHDYRHRIDRLTSGRHVFRLRQVDFDGAFTFSAEAEATVAAGAALVLGEAYPNPFNPQTTFTVALARSGWVRVALYDALGRRVLVLHEGPLEGEITHRFVVDGSGLPSGVYLVRAIGEAHQASTRVLLVK